MLTMTCQPLGTTWLFCEPSALKGQPCYQRISSKWRAQEWTTSHSGRGRAFAWRDFSGSLTAQLVPESPRSIAILGPLLARRCATWTEWCHFGAVRPSERCRMISWTQLRGLGTGALSLRRGCKIATCACQWRKPWLWSGLGAQKAHSGEAARKWLPTCKSQIEISAPSLL